jgi:hypothetical protein
LCNACAVEKRRGEALTREVKIKSNLEDSNVAATTSACRLPRCRDCALFTATPACPGAMQSHPMDRLCPGLEWDTHSSRRLVTDSRPRSPEAPLLSSTESRWSTTLSPRRS